MDFVTTLPFEITIKIFSAFVTSTLFEYLGLSKAWFAFLTHHQLVFMRYNDFCLADQVVPLTINCAIWHIYRIHTTYVFKVCMLVLNTTYEGILKLHLNDYIYGHEDYMVITSPYSPKLVI